MSRRKTPRIRLAEFLRTSFRGRFLFVLFCAGGASTAQVARAMADSECFCGAWWTARSLVLIRQRMGMPAKAGGRKTAKIIERSPYP